MATNGLRYGAAIEIRQNFTGQISNSGSSGASGYSSLETLYVRRAFTYFAGDNWGIVRAGQADGLIGIFDNGVTTFQFLPTGNLNGGDATNFPQTASATFVFLGQAGNEYDNAKLVYLSPQIAGFDFGIQYAPNTSNGNGIGGSNNLLNASLTGAGTGTGTGCTIANTGCPSLSSGPGIQDGSRALNQTAIGVRYQGAFGSLGLLAYGVYMISQAADYTGLKTAATLGTTTTPGSKFNGTYNGLSFGSGGVAATFAGFTVGGNVIGGKINGQLALQPSGGAPMLGFLAGAKYVNGPFTVGIVGEEYWEQGTVTLSGLTQRKAHAPRHRRELCCGTWLHGVRRVSLYGPDAERQQFPDGCGWRRGCGHRERRQVQQQRQGPDLPDRQRRELLSSIRLRRNGRREAIPAAVFLPNVGLAH